MMSKRKSADILEFKSRVATPDERQEVMDIVKSETAVASIIKAAQMDPGYSVRDLANSFGLPVVETAMDDRRLAAFLDENPDSESGFQIVVDVHMREESKRWAIIHELCHWIIDMRCGKNFFDRERIPPLLKCYGKKRFDTYNNYFVQVTDRYIGVDGKPVVSGRLIYEVFVDERLIRKSERMVNYLSGYVLLPESTLLCFMSECASIEEIARKCRLTTGVVHKQMRFIEERYPIQFKIYQNRLRERRQESKCEFLRTSSRNMECV